MKNLNKLIVLSILTLFVTTEVMAAGVAKRRIKRQKTRIENGKEAGNFSRVEKTILRRNIRQTRRIAKKVQEDGNVTSRERARFHSKLNKNSRMIKRFRKNDRPGMVELPTEGNTDTPAEEI